MIKLEHLSGGYGRTQVIEDLSLFFPNEQITAIVGPNGCGKSTLLKMCSGQLPYLQGEIFVDQKPLSGLHRKEVAQTISYLPQSRTVPEISVERLVMHGRFPWLGYPRVYREEDRRAAEIAMEQAGILEKRKKPLSALSGGERQKAYIAMVLAQNTSHVLLDEPTTYLDIVHQLELLELFSFLKAEHKAVVAVLHDLGMALDTADQIVVMKRGGLLFAGTPEQAAGSGALEEAFGVKLQRREQYAFFRRST